MTPILRIDKLSKYYVNGRNVVAGLNRVSLSFHRGEFVAITGESGSGKSTLAHVLGGVLPYEDGELYIAGEPTAHYDGTDWEAYRRDYVAFISQSYGILPGTSVYDNVASALRLGGMEKNQVASRTRAILEEVELWPMRRRRAARLSSGQKQRLAIARALAKPCPILIADEPTGNLDPENSEKVIRLLAQAAKERLVILITHEFSEAADYVTRHVRIHDGVIIGDEPLRPADLLDWTQARQKRRSPLGGYTARLQLGSRPVWVASVLLFFAATAFAVFAFLGSFIVATDDTSTRIYQSDAFLNGNQRRVVAVRKDGAPMTQADYETILAQASVVALERYGYIADTCYAYREGVDYKLHYSLKNIGTHLDPVYMSVQSVEFATNSQFVATVPLGVEDFLTDGRLPETVYEVVAGDERLLGQTLPVYIQDPRNWSVSAYLKLEMTVVGTTDYGSGLYFCDDLAAVLTMDFLGESNTVLPWYADITTHLEYRNYYTADERSMAAVNQRQPIPFHVEMNPTDESVQRPMEDKEVMISFVIYSNIVEGIYGADIIHYETLYNNGGRYISRYYPGVFSKDDPDMWREEEIQWDPWGLGSGMTATTIKVLDAHIAGVHESTLESAIYVSPAKFERYLAEHMENRGDQVSITIRDYSYTDRVITALEKAGYYALSPYVLGSTVVDEELAQQRMQTLYICLGALLAVILLQMILLRVLFGMENESYRLLSQIGLTWAGARNSIWLQVLLFMAVGQMLGFGAIGLGSFLGVERLVSLTKYLDGRYWALLSVVHMAVSAVAAKGILGSLKKKIFPLAARPRDLAPRGKEAVK